MKALLYIPIVCLLFFGCSKDDNDTKSVATVLGKWKQIESYQSDGGSSPTWIAISNGYTIEFRSDGTFTSTKFSDCGVGSYIVSITNEVVMSYSCDSFTTNDLQQIENLSGSIMILKPLGLNCDEGCGDKFQKF